MSPVPMIPVPLIRRKMILRRFLRSGAVDQEHAATPLSVGVHPRFLFSRLVKGGFLVDAGNGAYYVNTARF